MSSRLALATLPILVASILPIGAPSEATPIAMSVRESAEPGRTPVQQPTGLPCVLLGNTNGTAANYRWYNLCAGYIWIYADMAEEHVGTLFGGSAQPEVRGDNRVKRAITYFRNIGYGYTADIFIDVDDEGDGCPDYTLANDLDLNPGLRWNCSEFDVEIPCGVEYLIVRVKPDPPGSKPYDGIVSLATDGPYSAGCAPGSPTRSFYYGINVSACVPWVGPDGDPDNFLYWLVIDSSEPCPPNATSDRSWGAIKGLFR